MPFKGPLTSTHLLLPELQRNKHTVRCAMLGAKVPGQRQIHRTQTLILGLSKTHFFTPILDCEKWEWIEIVTIPLAGAQEENLGNYKEKDELLGDEETPENCHGISPIDLDSGSLKFRYDTGAPVGDCESCFVYILALPLLLNSFWINLWIFEMAT